MPEGFSEPSYLESIAAQGGLEVPLNIFLMQVTAAILLPGSSRALPMPPHILEIPCRHAEQGVSCARSTALAWL